MENTEKNSTNKNDFKNIQQRHKPVKIYKTKSEEKIKVNSSKSIKRKIIKCNLIFLKCL